MIGWWLQSEIVSGQGFWQVTVKWRHFKQFNLWWVKWIFLEFYIFLSHITTVFYIFVLSSITEDIFCGLSIKTASEYDQSYLRLCFIKRMLWFCFIIPVSMWLKDQLSGRQVHLDGALCSGEWRLELVGLLPVFPGLVRYPGQLGPQLSEGLL